RADWEGVWTRLLDASVTVATTNTSISAKGSLERESKESKLRLTDLSVAYRGEPAMQLENPANIFWSGSFHTRSNWQARIENFKLIGRGGNIAVQAAADWPAT